MTLDDYRKDFERISNRSISMPIAGAVVWLIVAIISCYVESNISVYILLFATGAIFPLALLISKFRQENLLSSTNPLSKLMGMCIVMVNLLWAVHIPLLFHAPELVPLSLGIGLGLHWVVYSWIINHPVGLVHAIIRSLLIVTVWFVVPEMSLQAIAVVIVVTYILSIYQMLTRKILQS